MGPRSDLFIYIATTKEHLNVHVNARGEIAECTGLAVAFKQGAKLNELLGAAPKDRFLVSTRIVDGCLVFGNPIDMEVDGDVPIYDYFVGIAPVVLAVPKEDDNYKDLYFFPVHRFASDHLILENVEFYLPPINAAEEWKIHAKGDHLVYVLVSGPQKYIVPLDEAFVFDRGQMIIRVHVSEIEAFEEWAKEMGLIEGEDYKDREVGISSIELPQFIGNPSTRESEYDQGPMTNVTFFGSFELVLAISDEATVNDVIYFMHDKLKVYVAHYEIELLSPERDEITPITRTSDGTLLFTQAMTVREMWPMKAGQKIAYQVYVK